MSEPERPVAEFGDRSLFPTLEARVFLNHCAISPPSLPVQRAAAEVVASVAARGVGAFTQWRDQREVLRQQLVELIGASSPEEIGLVANTTRGVLDIALCLPWERGDRLVLFEGEFPANVTPWQNAARVYGLEPVFLPLTDFAEPGGPDLGRLERELKRGGVRLVAVSAVQFQTGLRMPLTELATLCHAHGARLFVDAIQALGVAPLDVADQGVDYLSCGSHKWLMGLEGCAFIYARRDLLAELRPVVAGWLSHEEGLRFLFEGAGHLRYDRPFRSSLDFVEGGAYNSVGFAALGASVALLLDLGIDNIRGHVTRWLDALEAGLLQRGFTSLRAADDVRRAGILSVRAPQPATEVELAICLNQLGIACTSPDGLLRFAPHWPNALEEVPIVVDAIDEVRAR